MAKTQLDDILNPYFIHPSNNPGLLLVSQPPTRDNYGSWSHTMCTILLGKNTFVFELYASWDHNNNIVASWLLNSISKNIVTSHNNPRFFQLKKLLMDLVQGDYSLASILLGILLNFNILEYVTYFLMDLDDFFSQIIGKILMVNHIPPISKVFSLIIQEEKQKENVLLNSHLLIQLHLVSNLLILSTLKCNLLILSTLKCNLLILSTLNPRLRRISYYVAIVACMVILKRNVIN
ncbi:hypothetical protein CR513_03982, partial [Mucuna pruriens]